jgi:hypothetical protein
MTALCLVSLVLAAMMSVASMPAWTEGQAEQKPIVKIPEAGVAEVMTLEGTYVRAAYNNEGYAILGYRLPNLSIGEEVMLLEFGATLRDGVPYYKLTRGALSLETPDGKTILLATESEYRQGDVRSLLMRERVQRESINYFPPSARQACRIGFFAELESRAMMYDEVELSSTRGCVGRLFFQVPSGIAYGQHWLNVNFQNSRVRVPFRILTKDEEKLLSRNFKDIRRQVEDAFKPKKS